MKYAHIIITAILLSAGAMFLINNTKPTDSVPNNVHGLFASWMLKHSRSYKSASEKIFRLKVFYKNLLKVQESNAKHTDFELGLNKFSDMTEDEFTAKYLGFKKIITTKKAATLPKRANLNLPSSIDWVTKGAVTGVKDQGHCGGCWAFSSTGSLEGAYQLKNGQLLSFSEQQLIDCSKTYLNHGCNGGNMDKAFTYWKYEGATTEATYPYTAVDGTCHYDNSTAKAYVRDWHDLLQDESALEVALAERPVSIAIYALSIMQYKSGIYSDYSSCPAGRLDHAVLAVGYGTDLFRKFWKVKNSWGTSWGEGGYIRFARKNKGPGICGLATSCTYPIL